MVEKQRHQCLVTTSGCVVEWRFVLLVGLVDIHTPALCAHSQPSELVRLG
jgi:hypothetical protein